MVYHNYHQPGIIDPGELLAFHLWKHGVLSIRPCASRGSVEYIVLNLSYDVDLVYIFRRWIGADVEVYDMRVATSVEWVRAFVQHQGRRENAEER